MRVRSTLAARFLVAAVLTSLTLVAACSDPPGPNGGRKGGGSGDGSGAAPGAGVNAQGGVVPPDVNNPGGIAASDTGKLEFTDVSTAAGIRFKHNSGATGKKFLPETMGAGCAFVDFDNDGWQDIFLVNSANLPDPKGSKTPSALYHNNKDGTFSDVTSAAGLGGDFYGFGVAVGDFDNDGFDDLYLTCLGPNHLFHNNGNGTFSDVTAKAGVGDPSFSTSAAWVDYDKDGKLDLFVCNYVDWSAANDIRCALDGKNKSYCTPEVYKGESPTLYHNRGNGTFEDVTKRAGLDDPTCKSLGVALVDYDADGWTDLFVANDTQPNKLYRNKGDGTFVDTAVEAGVAFSDVGAPRAGMGVDAADFDGSGKFGLVLGNFTNEMMSLYTSDGAGLFTDQARSTPIGKASAQNVTFSTFFFDYDLDGLLDVLAVNGHVADDIANVQPQLAYAEKPLVFRNTGGGKFAEVSSQLGDALKKPIVGRGACYGDFDNDGDLDVLVTENNGPTRLLRNDGGSRNNALRVKAVGATSNRDGVGALITVKTGSGATLRRAVKSGSSYCSQSELPVTFGLGGDTAITSLEVAWPSGRVESLATVQANQFITVQEGVGVVASVPLKR